MKTRLIEAVDYQIATSPDPECCVLEFIDESEEVFLKISVDRDDVYFLTFYKSDQHLKIPVEALLKGIEIAKEKVKNLDLDEWD